MQSLQKVEQSSTSGNCCESKKAALHSLEMICYTGQSVYNLYRNGVATQVAKEIAPCNTSLTGEALSSISGLGLTSDNYKEAVDNLKKRYGNPQALITAYMETLLKLSKVKGKDVSGLRKLFNEVENCLRSLRSLKVETSTYGSLLLPLLKDKVTDDFLIQIGRRFGTEVWTLDLFGPERTSICIWGVN